VTVADVRFMAAGRRFTASTVVAASAASQGSSRRTDP
jgi:hypothetical protein